MRAEGVPFYIRGSSEAGHSLEGFSVTIWPGSWRPDGTFDVELARAYRDAGANRLMIAALEGGGVALGDVRKLVARYRDEIAGPF